MSWDPNLCMEWSGKVLTPFHYFVEPQPQQCPAPSCSPFPFFSLPIDLQLVIYEQCDVPTLFQLMRTCSRTRDPAAKLFWTNTSTDLWYHCSDSTLFEFRSHDYVIVRHCPEFARRITKIEIDLGRLEFCFKETEEPHLFREVGTTAKKARVFWNKVVKAFPAAERVIMTGCTPRRLLPPPPGEFDDSYAIIESVVKRAPPHVTVHVAFSEMKSWAREQFALWQVGNDLEPEWNILDRDWTPIRVLLPVRKFSVSPLGDLLTFMRRESALVREKRGLDWMMIETYARYAVDGVIYCPCLNCDATFSGKDQWKQHVADANHWRLGPGYEEDPMMDLLYFKHTPEPVKAMLEARKERIRAGWRQTKRLWSRVGCGWSEDGSEQRLRFEEQFFAQLREESFETSLELLTNPEQGYEGWMHCLWAHYDPTHVYYAGY